MPTKQPVFHGKYTGCFFSFVAQMESKIIDMCLYYIHIHDMLHFVVGPSPFGSEYLFCHSRGD